MALGLDFAACSPLIFTYLANQGFLALPLCWRKVKILSPARVALQSSGVGTSRRSVLGIWLFRLNNLFLASLSPFLEIRPKNIKSANAVGLFHDSQKNLAISRFIFGRLFPVG
jgi:hypothetical protein